MCRGAVPRLLQHILLVVTFKWNVHKLIYLKSVLQTKDVYPTQVTVHVICDNSEALKCVLELWELRAIVHQSKAESEAHAMHKAGDEVYGMLWDHRKIVEEAVAAGLYTTYIYIEDDTGINWATLLSWALDQQVLEPLGFSRAFYRTEIRKEDGMPVLLDVYNRVDLDTYNYTLTLPRTDQLCFPLGRAGGTKVKVLCPNSHFIQLTPSYMGMWLASHATLTKWMQHAFWDKDNALKAETNPNFGYPERSNGMFMFIDVPEAFQTSYLVPYDPVQKVLRSEARVYHERNGYSTQPGSIHAKLEERAIFVPSSQ